MCIALRPPPTMLSSSMLSEVAWAAMIPWRPAALMATTFCMTLSRSRRLDGASLAQIVSEPKFRDVCTPRGKWFHARENCFVARLATKHPELKCEQFQQKLRSRVRAASRRKARGARPTAAWGSGLLAGRREQIAAAADGADHGGLARVDLDFS